MTGHRAGHHEEFCRPTLRAAELAHHWRRDDYGLRNVQKPLTVPQTGRSHVEAAVEKPTGGSRWSTLHLSGYSNVFSEGALSTRTSSGPDFVICDEGHILRNANSNISKAMGAVKTRRRVVLTGTPLQNNLVECKFAAPLRECDNESVSRF